MIKRKFSLSLIPTINININSISTAMKNNITESYDKLDISINELYAFNYASLC